jgi:acetyl esterase/lipase
MLRRSSSVILWPTAILVITLLPGVVWGQLSETATWASDVVNHYSIVPNITYLTADGYEAKLDVYHPRNSTKPNPTVLYIHGGGWVRGMKETSTLRWLPYLEMGWTVVNVEYRLANVSLAPAAVEDCRCALRWIIQNAEKYNFDTNQIVVTGHSAGGHLSLTTGMLPASAGLDGRCPGNEDLKVAAIVNWFGITDVAELLDEPNVRSYAVAWMGGLTNRREIAERVSPITYVRPGLPPILTIHGDADPVVPHSQAVRLHEALTQAGVPNQLLTIPGGEHSRFSTPETVRAYITIREFLKKYSGPS